MKWIKLFESFNSGKEDEVINDIKTIAYILEDKEYRIEYLTKDDVYRRSSITDMYGVTRGGVVPNFDIQLIIKLPEDFVALIDNKLKLQNIDLNNDPVIIKYHEDVNHFLIMLKEHLDYVSDIKLDILIMVCRININL